MILLYTVTASSLNVRSGPSTSYTIVDSLSNGSVCEVLEVSGDWGRIGTDRWVSMYYLSEIYVSGDTSDAVSTIIALATSQIGVVEVPDNEVIYNTEYYGRVVNGSAYAWCCAFIWWLFYKCSMSDLFYGGEKTAYCPTLKSYYEGKKQNVTVAQAGDIAFFNWDGGTTAQHVGIVVDASDPDNVITIEGNTGADNSNGGQVMQRTRSSKYIIGYARPNYPVNEVVEEEDTSVSSETLALVNQAISYLVNVGFLNTPDHWYEHAFDIAYLPNLIILIANALDIRQIRSDPNNELTTDVEGSLDYLTEIKVINSPDYWASNYSKVQYLSTFICKAAAWLS